MENKELIILENTTPDNILNVEVKQGSISFDVEKVKAVINSYLEKYDGLIIEENQIKEIKAEVAFLRKQKTLINKNRIELSKEYDKPLIEYKSNCDSIMDMIENAIYNLNNQLLNFEEKRQQLKLKQIEELKKRITNLQHLDDGFELEIKKEYLNSTYSISKIKKDFEEQILYYREEQKAVKQYEENIKIKKHALEDLINKANENNNLTEKLSYVELEYLLDEVSLEELPNKVQSIIEERITDNSKETEDENITVVETPEKTINATLKLFDITESQLTMIKEYLTQNQIKFEQIPEIDELAKTFSDEFEINA